MANTIDNFDLALPQPYFTRFRVRQSNVPASVPAFQLLLEKKTSSQQSAALPLQLHNEDLKFSELRKGEEVAANNNTQWARARRSPSLTLQWKASNPPSLAQVWLITYAMLSFYSEHEQVRVQFEGSSLESLQNDLLSVGLAIRHPAGEVSTSTELLILRSAFWQGAGSPFGPRPVWLADSSSLRTTSQTLSNYPSQPLTYTLTNSFPTTPIYAHHPVRPAKPTPGSTIYSRYIPHLKEYFSMVVLDYEKDEHLQLFHKWQNDPRVAQGWNETGTLEQHREYLRRLHEDPHVLTVLARFQDTFFAYFEIYWGKEDTLGAHYPASDYDRGRHSLVGDINFRGPNRVAAWWSSLMHYIFLDEPRTQFVVGEPKATNTRVLAYDLAHGFNIDGWVDFPHKRSAIVRCSRERYFSMCPFGWDEGVDEGVYRADEFLKRVRGSKL